MRLESPNEADYNPMDMNVGNIESEAKRIRLDSQQCTSNPPSRVFNIRNILTDVTEVSAKAALQTPNEADYMNNNQMEMDMNQGNNSKEAKRIKLDSQQCTPNQ